MLPTFVIGLREGLEAALIVGIIAAFLRKQGRRDLLRLVFFGVGIAIVLCVAAGVALDVLSKDLPQKQQEGLETVIGVLAVGMVTYMVVWMKRNSRNLKGQLEGMAADAMHGGSRAGRAMIFMAFLAVLREGIETVVFLLAVFNQSTSGVDAPIGAALGILVAVVLGYGIYRGGVRINLSKFFRATGLVLVLVAAGLVVNALHTAHEAGWLNVGQGATVDLSWLVNPGSVQASLLTGMLGLQPQPVVIEVVGWLVYLVPVALFVAWPPGRSPARRTVVRVFAATGAGLAVAAVVLAVVAPGRPGAPSATGGARVRTLSSGSITVTSDGGQLRLSQGRPATRDGVALRVYTARHAGSRSAEMPATLSDERIATLNGGRLPIGLHPSGSGTPVRYSDSVTETVLLEPRTHRIVSARSVETITAAAVSASGAALSLSRPVQVVHTGTGAAAETSALSNAKSDLAALHRRSVLAGFGWTAGVLAALALLAAAALALPRRREPHTTRAAAPAGELAQKLG
ncbi:MAG TPA: iron uptake transporter permease EfeU [Jatrophihabitantaceae bacterium]